MSIAVLNYLEKYMEIKECKEQNNKTTIKQLSSDSKNEVEYHPTYTLPHRTEPWGGSD